MSIKWISPSLQKVIKVVIVLYLIYVMSLYLFRKAVQLYNTLTKIPETIQAFVNTRPIVTCIIYYTGAIILNSFNQRKSLFFCTLVLPFAWICLYKSKLSIWYDAKKTIDIDDIVIISNIPTNRLKVSISTIKSYISEYDIASCYIGLSFSKMNELKFIENTIIIVRNPNNNKSTTAIVRTIIVGKDGLINDDHIAVHSEKMKLLDLNEESLVMVSLLKVAPIPTKSITVVPIIDGNDNVSLENHKKLLDDYFHNCWKSYSVKLLDIIMIIIPEKQINYKYQIISLCNDEINGIVERSLGTCLIDHSTEISCWNPLKTITDSSPTHFKDDSLKPSSVTYEKFEFGHLRKDSYDAVLNTRISKVDNLKAQLELLKSVILEGKILSAALASLQESFARDPTLERVSLFSDLTKIIKVETSQVLAITKIREFTWSEYRWFYPTLLGSSIIILLNWIVLFCHPIFTHVYFVRSNTEEVYTFVQNQVVFIEGTSESKKSQHLKTVVDSCMNTSFPHLWSYGLVFALAPLLRLILWVVYQVKSYKTHCRFTSIISLPIDMNMVLYSIYSLVCCFGLVSYFLYQPSCQSLAIYVLGTSIQLSSVEKWRFVTSMFMHSSWNHIMGNMSVLSSAGPLFLELYLGPWKYLLLYMCSGLMGGVVSALDIVYLEDYSSRKLMSVGASGAVFGVWVSGDVLLGSSIGGIDGRNLALKILLTLACEGILGLKSNVSDDSRFIVLITNLLINIFFLKKKEKSINWSDMFYSVFQFLNLIGPSNVGHSCHFGGGLFGLLFLGIVKFMTRDSKQSTLNDSIPLLQRQISENDSQYTSNNDSDEANEPNEANEADSRNHLLSFIIISSFTVISIYGLCILFEAINIIPEIDVLSKSSISESKDFENLLSKLLESALSRNDDKLKEL